MRLYFLMFSLLCAIVFLGCQDNKKEEPKETAQVEQTKDSTKEDTIKSKEYIKEEVAKPTPLNTKKNVVILATGGTIAGSASSHIDTTGYTAGAIGINAIMEAVPDIKDISNVKGEQIVNIDSSNMSNEIWLVLAKRVNELLMDNAVDGIVITHGTDTLEETAFFLHLTTKSDKPVVIVGAMRPSSAISADSAKNLYNAVSLAADTNTKGKGVLVVMNDKIQSARYVSKTHTLNLDAFSSPNSGDMGYIIDGNAFFYTLLNKPHTTTSEFDISTLDELPKVDILYSYANDGSSIAAQALFNNGTKGIVVAGSGAGSIHKDHKETLKQLMKEGLIVVMSSRVNNGIVLADEEDSKLGFIGGNDLNPQKARVLLMLALTKSNNVADIAKIFDTY